MVIYLYAEDQGGNPPNQQDLQQWANTYGMTFPVLADTNWMITSKFISGPSIYLPTYQLIAPGMDIVAVDQWQSGISNALIEANLP